jgi:hypothetical protein
MEAANRGAVEAGGRTYSAQFLKHHPDLRLSRRAGAQ